MSDSLQGHPGQQGAEEAGLVLELLRGGWGGPQNGGGRSGGPREGLGVLCPQQAPGRVKAGTLAALPGWSVHSRGEQRPAWPWAVSSESWGAEWCPRGAGRVGPPSNPLDERGLKWMRSLLCDGFLGRELMLRCIEEGHMGRCREDAKKEKAVDWSAPERREGQRGRGREDLGRLAGAAQDPTPGASASHLGPLSHTRVSASHLGSLPHTRGLCLTPGAPASHLGPPPPSPFLSLSLPPGPLSCRSWTRWRSGIRSPWPSSTRSCKGSERPPSPLLGRLSPSRASSRTRAPRWVQ